MHGINFNPANISRSTIPVKTESASTERLSDHSSGSLSVHSLIDNFKAYLTEYNVFNKLESTHRNYMAQLVMGTNQMAKKYRHLTTTKTDQSDFNSSAEKVGNALQNIRNFISYASVAGGIIGDQKFKRMSTELLKGIMGLKGNPALQQALYELFAKP